MSIKYAQTFRNCITVFLVGSCSLTSRGKEISSKMDTVMNQFVERTNFSGSVLVADKGTIVYKKAFGYANREWNIPNTTDTKFRIASLTKQFTALLIMQLVAEGKVKLDGHISDYLPAYPTKTGSIITIHQLLTHSSGIPNYHAVANYDEEVAVKKVTPEEHMALFSNKDLVFEPGTDAAYTNFGYNILAYIAEKVTGKPYGRLLQERIFTPAGMENSTVEEYDRLIKKLAAGYNDVYTNYKPTITKDPSTSLGAGNVITTVEDFYKYDKALRSGKLIAGKYQDLMNTKHIANYGYGWMIDKYSGNGKDSTTLSFHDGGRDGFISLAYRFIDDDKLIVVFSNTRPCNVYAIANNLRRVLYNKEIAVPKHSLVALFAITTEKSGVDSAVKEYNRLSKNETDYELNGSEFNVLGYSYMRSGKMNEALAVFKINVAAYPGYGDPYDSLAEAYMKTGNNELAIKNYKRALELDPGNSNAKLMLEKLSAAK